MTKKGEMLQLLLEDDLCVVFTHDALIRVFKDVLLERLEEND